MIRRFSIIALLATILAGCFVTTTPDPDITISRLLALLHSSDPTLRQTAALSLGKIASAEAAAGLMEALHAASYLSLPSFEDSLPPVTSLIAFGGREITSSMRP